VEVENNLILVYQMFLSMVLDHLFSSLDEQQAKEIIKQYQLPTFGFHD